MRRMILGTALVLIAFSARLQAGVINTSDRGWYNENGIHNPSNDNYIAGINETSLNFHNFFTFDLSSVSGPVTSASFTVYTHDITGAGTYTLYDFTSNISNLTSGTGGVAAFNDLGTGTSYGSIALTTSDGYSLKTITLNAAGLAALNANIGGTFVFGGEFGSTDGLYSFGFSGSENPGDGNTSLEYQSGSSPSAVPEPASMITLAAGAIGMLGFRMRKRKVAAGVAA